MKITVGISIPFVESVPCWNFQKANWKKFQQEIETNIRWIPARRSNYKRFTGVVNAAAKRNIPRGFRKEYIPGWSDNLEQMYKEFEESGDSEISEELLDALTVNRRAKWARTTENLDFTRSSRKAWTILRKLGAAKNTVTRKERSGAVTPDMIASRIVKLSDSANVSKFRKKYVKDALRAKKKLLTSKPQFSRPFDISEIQSCIDSLKLGKAAGADNMYPEFIKNLGDQAMKWLQDFLNDILTTRNIPREFRKSKVVAIL